jgi:hypothetical protein
MSIAVENLSRPLKKEATTPLPRRDGLFKKSHRAAMFYKN